MAGKSYSLEYGNRCRQIRMAKGLSQQALAEKMNTTPQNISKWERDGISNVDTVMQLSEVLGQDITADEIDQEGSVGEVGKEILLILVKNKGYYEFPSLVNDLYGLPKDRVSNEIFKLERIGNVVREQYKDWLNKDRDGVFITAKGIITLKNSTTFPPFNEIQEAVAYEKRIGKSINFNDKIQKDEVSKLIWKLPDEHSSYRVGYIKYLMDHYRETFPNDNEPQVAQEFELWNQILLPADDCYFDTLYYMALGYDRSFFEIDEEELDESLEVDLDIDRKIKSAAQENGATYYDFIVERAQSKFESLFPSIGAKLEAVKKRNKEIEESVDVDDSRIVTEEQLIKEFGDDYSVYCNENFQQQRFERFVGENINKICNEWFSDDQIVEFVEKNYRPAESEYEHSIDEIIRKINMLNPETMDYYYCFPDRWEQNGMAQKIRDVWGLPDVDGYHEIIYKYEEMENE